MFLDRWRTFAEKELIERGMKYFRSNLVATNGTLELPDWPDVNFYISVDGKKEMHDAIRGKGCHERIKNMPTGLS